MLKFEELDRNFFVDIKFDTENLSFYDAKDEQFKIHGLIFPKDENDCFRRMPAEVAENVNEGVAIFHKHSAGGRLRFKTNSSKIAIFTKMSDIYRGERSTLVANAGFDMYVNNRYFKTFIPHYDMRTGYNAIIDTGNNAQKEIHINFPLYSAVNSLVIGLEKGATVGESSPYKYEKPVVYYGSSITQGGCASRPGLAYTEQISRRLGCDYINLGFSGSARGEKIMAEYLSGLDMSVFVYDYDANATNAEHLQNTHKAMFEIIREKNPNLPIIMVTYPNADLNYDKEKRRQIIKNTYLEALEKGDKNVYFIDACEMMRRASDDNSTTVDGIHPNDYGFMVMANRIGADVEKALDSIYGKI